jgi:CRISPR system Cascade subunit CasD
MRDYLIFRLYGPMTSWGGIAVGEVRPSGDHPTRSALVGLVAAALGIRRDDTERLRALETGYDVATKVTNRGILLKDYHTVQVPDNAGRIRYLTRRDELITGRNRLGTILTTREYYCDALHVAAFRERNAAPYPLAQLQAALERPKFTLYLGRKSCPVSAPLKPRVVSGSGFREALDADVFPPLVASTDGMDLTAQYISARPVRYYWEGDAAGMREQMTTERHDEPVDRDRWQFTSRLEHSMSLEGEE